MPFAVPTRSSGPIWQVTVWLDDGLSSAWRGMTPVGALKEAPVDLVPQKAGTFRLYAKGLDVDGCERDRTQTARWVTVQ